MRETYFLRFILVEPGVLHSVYVYFVKWKDFSNFKLNIDKIFKIFVFMHKIITV